MASERMEIDWEGKNNWRSMGADFENTQVKDEKIQRSEDCGPEANSHYALKFRDAEIDEFKVEVEIPRPDESEVFVVMATGDDSEGMNSLEKGKFETSKRIDLVDGKNEIDTDIEWRDFTFFKVVLHIYKEGIESPKIRNIKIKGEQERGVIEKESKVEEEEPENLEEVAEEPEIPPEEEEEMPAFEDVEYKDLECPECGEDFKTDIGLKVHRKVNHPDSYKGD